MITVDYLCLIPKYNSIESIKPQSLNGQSFPSLYILSYCAVQGWFRDSITPLVACWKGSASGCIADSLNQKSRGVGGIGGGEEEGREGSV